jgi:acyl carrier protein
MRTALTRPHGFTTLEDVMSDNEEKLLRVLREALGTDATMVTSHTGFGELGLDSIAGLRFARRAEDALGMHIELEWLFDYPNVAELVSFLETRGNANDDHAQSERTQLVAHEP